MNAPHKPTLQFYRRLLKTMVTSFTGDYEMFHRCRLEAKKKILENKDETDLVSIHNQIFFGEEARDFISTNMIQG